MKLTQLVYQDELYGVHYKIPLDQMGAQNLQPNYSSGFQKRLLSLYNMTQRLAESNTRKELYDIAMESSCNILQVDRTSIGVIDERNHSISLATRYGVETQFTKVFSFDLDECAIGTSYLENAISYRPSIAQSTCPLIMHLYKIGIRSTLVCPIYCGDIRLGTLNAGSLNKDNFSIEDMHLMAQISAILVTHLHNLDLREAADKKRQGIEDTNSKLKVIASIDALTQIYNRRHINSVITHELEQQFRRKSPYSLIMFDIDLFKNINDQHGHLLGDEVLCEITALCKMLIRKNDVFARWGGEEFVISCSNTNVDDATLLAEKIRKKFVSYTTNSGMKVTASFGVTEFHQDDSIDALISRLDLALYQAKHEGRNRVQML